MPGVIILAVGGGGVVVGCGGGLGGCCGGGGLWGGGRFGGSSRGCIPLSFLRPSLPSSIPRFVGIDVAGTRQILGGDRECPIHYQRQTVGQKEIPVGKRGGHGYGGDTSPCSFRTLGRTGK